MSTIQVAQNVMGYLSANERTSCKQCFHVEQSIADGMPPYGTKSWRCKKGGFATSAMAVCNEFQPVFKQKV